MIIVEGPDGAGKSTLVQHLLDHTGFPQGARSVVDRKDLFKVTRPDLYRALSLEVAGVNPPLLWDRMYFSELVYWMYTTGKCQFTKKEQDFVYKTLEAWQVPIVVCLPPFEVVRDNVAKSDKIQTHYAVQYIEPIYFKYEKLRFPMQSVYYDYTKDNGALEALYARIGQFMAVREERNPSVAHYTP